MAKTIASKSVLITLVIAVLIAASATVFVLKRRYDKNRWTRVTVAQVEADIKQHVPIGSPREQVTAYLDAQKISHSFLGGDLYQNTPDYNCEVALIPHTASSGLITTDIQITFEFDNAMKLVSYNVREINRGP
jgi:hypothetical protein